MAEPVSRSMLATHARAPPPKVGTQEPGRGGRVP